MSYGLIGKRASSFFKTDKGSCFTANLHQLQDSISELERSSSAAQVECEVYAGILRQCSATKALAEGRRVHALISRGAHRDDRYLGNLLVQMYGKCNSLAEATSVYNRMSHRNSFSWTIMLQACAQNGNVSQATILFERMPRRDLVSWSSMVAAYAENGYTYEALGVYRTMDLEGIEVDAITVLTTLDACHKLGHVRMVHSSLSDSELESDVKVSTAFITSYARCKSLASARRVFSRMSDKNLVTWNAMIAAYAQNGDGKEALAVFRLMDLEGVKPGPVTFTSILEICAIPGALADGRFIHAKAVASGCQRDYKVASALVNMYGKCGSVKDAREVFDEIPEKNVVTWSAMVAAYSQNKLGREALHLAMLMDLEGLLPNEITLVSIVDACACIPALREGRLIHESITSDSSTPILLELGNALVHMYGTCGALEEAMTVFNSMPHRDGITWNAIISAYSQNGLPDETLHLFLDMKLDGTAPSVLTLSSILSACSHAGLLEPARDAFFSFLGDFNIRPEAAHFSCMIDVLGRAGRVSDSQELINSMPYEPSVLEWASLLGGCKTSGNVRGGAEAARELLLDVEDLRASPYILMANIWRDGSSDDHIQM